MQSIVSDCVPWIVQSVKRLAAGWVPGDRFSAEAGFLFGIICGSVLMVTNGFRGHVSRGINRKEPASSA